MRNNQHHFLFFFAIVFLSACYNVRYVGDSYAPTEQVETYYDEAEVPEYYQVIGRAVFSGGNDKISRSKLVDRAKKEGADAILIEDVYNAYAQNSQDNVSSKVQVKAQFLKRKSD